MTEVVAADLLPGERIDLHRPVRVALAAERGSGSVRPGRAARPPLVPGGRRRSRRCRPRSLRRGRRGGRTPTPRRTGTAARGGAAFALSGDPVCAPRGAPGSCRPGGRARSDHDQAVRLLAQLLDDRTAPGGMVAALLHACKGGARRAAGRVTEAAQSYQAAAALLPPQAPRPSGRRCSPRTAPRRCIPGVLGRAHGRAAGVGAGPRRGSTHHRGADLVVLGFSLAYLEDATAGAAALDKAVAVAEGTGEPEAIVEAHVRRAELLRPA